jgi:TRAP-type C4-dicarboxylate transport system permease small subunit
MLVANLVNIGVRVVFDRSMLWVFPWTTVLFVWCTFIGMYVIYRRGTDITVDFFYERAGGIGRTAIRVFADLVVILVLVAILSVATNVLAAQRGDIELTFLKRWMLSVPLFVSSALVVADVALDLARAALGLPSRPHGHRAVP